MVEEITAHDFDSFSNNHILSSYHESSNYATLMSKFGYERKGPYMAKKLI